MMTTGPLHEAVASQQRSDEARRAELRIAAGITEPQYGRFPIWLRPRVNAVGLRPHRSAGFGNCGCQTGWQACEALERHVDDYLAGRLFDHHGRIRRLDGVWLLVSEPYLDVDDSNVIAGVEAIAELLMLNHSIQAASWWNPPSTIRITWWPRHGQDERKVRRVIRKLERDKSIS